MLKKIETNFEATNFFQNLYGFDFIEEVRFTKSQSIWLVHQMWYHAYYLIQCT
jgi:hypothetical protein